MARRYDRFHQGYIPDDIPSLSKMKTGEYAAYGQAGMATNIPSVQPRYSITSERVLPGITRAPSDNIVMGGMSYQDRTRFPMSAVPRPEGPVPSWQGIRDEVQKGLGRTVAEGEARAIDRAARFPNAMSPQERAASLAILNQARQSNREKAQLDFMTTREERDRQSKIDAATRPVQERVAGDIAVQGMRGEQAAAKTERAYTLAREQIATTSAIEKAKLTAADEQRRKEGKYPGTEPWAIDEARQFDREFWKAKAEGQVELAKTYMTAYGAALSKVSGASGVRQGMEAVKTEMEKAMGTAFEKQGQTATGAEAAQPAAGAESGDANANAIPDAEEQAHGQILAWMQSYDALPPDSPERRNPANLAKYDRATMQAQTYRSKYKAQLKGQ